MAQDLNSVVMIGRLTRDAEIKYSSAGTAIVKFALAQTHRKKTDETWSDEAHFFDVTMMGKSAEGVHKYLVKGKQVGLQGELRQNRWKTDSGDARSKVEIFAFSVQLLGGGAQGSENHGTTSAQQAEGTAQDAVPYDPADDKIPF